MRAFASPAVQHPHFTARTASCVAGILGLTALTGWAFDIPALKSAAPGFIAMQPWTATAIILAAAALWLARFDGSAARAVSAIAAIALAIIVGLPIFEYATGANLGTDVLLFPNSVVSTQTVPYPNPGRMSPLTSTGLVSLAAALLLAPRVQGRVESIVFSALASVGLALTAVSAVSYVLRLESLDSMVLHNPVAIPTALALAALSLGTLTLRPDAGWVAIVAKQGSPGWLAAGLLGGAVLLLMFGSEAAVTMGVVDRATFEAARRLDHLLSTLKDAETGQRGFLLTGQDSYLEPYEAARASLSDEFERAEASLAQAYGSPSRLTTLRSLVTAKMAELAETVALRRAGDAAGAVVVVQRGRGQSLMEAIRSQVDVLSLALGNAGPANGARIETAAAIAGLGAVGLAALAFWSLIAAGRVTREASESAEESAARQRDLLATLSLGTFMARDMNGVIRYWAEGCARLYGWTAEEAVGRSAHELLGTIFPSPRTEIEAILEREGEWTGDLRHHTQDGRELLVTVHKVLRRSGPQQPAVLLEFLTDVTAQRRAEVGLDSSLALMKTVIEATPGLIYAKDRLGRVILANNAVGALVNRPTAEMEGHTDLELLEDSRRAAACMSNDRRVMETGVPEELEELTDAAGGQARVWLSIKAPMRDAAGSVIGMVGVSLEITERKRAEDRLRLMVDELNHRVKNTLVTVQAVAAQTLRGVDPAVNAALEGRLQALAAVHDVLTRESWRDAALDEVIGNALAPFGVAGDARFEASGPPLRLLPRVAVTLSMALHELATNAIKYGAWSTAAGRVRIRWEISGGAEPRVRVEWSEHDGPPVATPLLRGFGTRMIERSLARDLRGTAKIDFDPAGLTCTIDASLAEIVATTRIMPLPRVGRM